MNTVLGGPDADLHVRAWGDGRGLRAHKAWLKVFETWEKVMRRYHDHAGDDLGWWHGERPNISLLANAVVLSGGSAVQEYGAHKGKHERYGRPDLFTIIDGRRYGIEGKQAWPRLNGGVVDDYAITAFRSALLDAREVTETNSTQTGICFATAKVASRSARRIKELVRDFRQEAIEGAPREARSGFRVDLFPSWVSEDRMLANSHYFPGVTVLVGFVD